jgi:hypothetical protein
MTKKTKLLKQMEMFNEMSRHKLSPNQYYLLCCIRDSISPLRINMHLELRSLVAEGWLVQENKHIHEYKLTPKSYTLIDQLESLFKINKRKTSNQILGDKFKENIAQYTQMFPNQKLPSGKAARSAPGNLEKNFRWFFDNFNYEWELILQATGVYINEHQKNNYLYMRTSQYFIRKDNLSDLADLCENILNGGYEEEKKTIKVKVV